MTKNDNVRYNVHMNKILPATTVRAHFFKIVEDTTVPGRVVTITIEGEPKVVMMPAEDFEEWQETIDILTDQKLMEGIKKGLQDIKKGKLYSAKEVKKMLKL